MNGNAAEDAYIQFRDSQSQRWNLTFTESELETAYEHYYVARTMRDTRLTIVTVAVGTVLLFIYAMAINNANNTAYMSLYSNKVVTPAQMQADPTKYCVKGWFCQACPPNLPCRYYPVANDVAFMLAGVALCALALAATFLQRRPGYSPLYVCMLTTSYQFR